MFISYSLYVFPSQSFDKSVTVVDHLLRALWEAEYQGRFSLYRLGIVLLADVGLEFMMTKWSTSILDDVMPQVRVSQ